MSRPPETVDRGDEFYHVRYRDPDDFDDIRTPDWAERPAGSVLEGAEVRTGDTKGDDDWTVQSILVPVDAVDSGDAATQAADEILAKLED
jgi:hypothetical protein